ncbi:MAG: hypothetical protein OEU26_29170 [Candidatus Tectomicrobia bacterium]|nr:hypothetical protein [Candidatus Tectomicrobia bacterium]
MSNQMRQLWLWGIMACLLGAATVVNAAEYQLRLAHLEDSLFFRYVETQGHPFRAERHVLPKLHDILDQAKLSTHLLIPDRHAQVIRAPNLASPQELAATAPHRDDPWDTVQWKGAPGQSIVFRISGRSVHYQELTALAVKTQQGLRRLPVHRVPLFGSRKMLAPSMSSTYIDYRLERGTFATVVAKHATAFEGLSVIVGRNDDPRYPDSVYVHVYMPPEPKQYTIVLAWKDRDALRKDADENGMERN